MPQIIAEQRYQHQLVTRVVVANDHVTIYVSPFLDFAKHKHGNIMHFFSNRLNACILYNSEYNGSHFHAPSENNHLGRRFRLSERTKSRLTDRDWRIVNQHRTLTRKHFHVLPSLWNCFKDELSQTHIHVQLNRGEMTAHTLQTVLDMLDDYQMTQGAFADLLAVFCAKIAPEGLDAPLLAKMRQYTTCTIL